MVIVGDMTINQDGDMWNVGTKSGFEDEAIAPSIGIYHRLEMDR